MSAVTPRPVRNLDEAFAACLDDLDAGLSPAQRWRAILSTPRRSRRYWQHPPRLAARIGPHCQ